MIKKIWRFIVDDTKEDIETIKRIKREGRLLPEAKAKALKEEWKRDGWKGFLKTAWIVWLAMSLLFVMGWAFSAKYHQIECNNFVYENYIRPQNIGEWHIVRGPGERGFGLGDVSDIFKQTINTTPTQ